MSSQVPDFKKNGLGAVSVIIFSEDFTSFIAMHDYEKSSRGKQRFALPGGTKEEEDRGDPLYTALREAHEEMGHQFAPKDLVQMPYFVGFGSDSRKDFFVALLPSNTKLRETGTRQVIQRNGQEIDMEVLGPPIWVSIEKALKLAPKGYDTEDRFFLHPSHLRGVIEALLFLKGREMERRSRSFAVLWSNVGLKVSELRRKLGGM